MSNGDDNDKYIKNKKEEYEINKKKLLGEKNGVKKKKKKQLVKNLEKKVKNLEEKEKEEKKTSRKKKSRIKIRYDSSKISKKSKKIIDKINEDEDAFKELKKSNDEDAKAFFANLFLHGSDEWTNEGIKTYKKEYNENNSFEPREKEEDYSITDKYITGVDLKDATEDVLNFVDYLTYTPIGKGLIPFHALLGLFMGDDSHVKEYMLFDILPNLLDNPVNNFSDLLDYLNVYYVYQDLIKKYKHKKTGVKIDDEPSDSSKIARNLIDSKNAILDKIQYFDGSYYKSLNRKNKRN